MFEIYTLYFALIKPARINKRRELTSGTITRFTTEGTNNRDPNHQQLSAGMRVSTRWINSSSNPHGWLGVKVASCLTTVPLIPTQAVPATFPRNRFLKLLLQHSDVTTYWDLLLAYPLTNPSPYWLRHSNGPHRCSFFALILVATVCLTHKLCLPATSWDKGGGGGGSWGWHPTSDT